MAHPASFTRPIPRRAPSAYRGRIEREPRELSTLSVTLFFGFAINILTAETDWLWAPLTAYPWAWVPVSALAWFLWRLWRRRKSAVTWTGGENPYPGLASFDADRTAVFFGRDQETGDVLRRLERSGVGSQQRFVTLIGPSGSGKSSLLRAGVLPRLSKRWRLIGPMQPGPDVFHDLSVACDGEPLRDHLSGNSSRTILVIDQLEDLFTQSRPEDRAPFLDLLHDALTARPEFHIVVTLRPEFLASASEIRKVLFARPVPVAPLDPRHLRDAIERPAAAAGVTFEPGLVDLMVAEATVGDALPLLGHLLQRLYAESTHRRITFAQYDAAGRVGGAIAGHADVIYQELTSVYPQRTVEGILLRLVGLDGDDPVRRALPRPSTGDDAAIVAELRRARLLTDRGDGAEVVFAHDAIFRQWKTLADLVEKHQAELAEITLLERRAAVWTRSRSDDELLRGKALSRAESVTVALALSAELRVFLEASAAERGRMLTVDADDIAGKVPERAGDDTELALAVVVATMRELAPSPIARLVLWSLIIRPVHERFRIGHTAKVIDVRLLADGRFRSLDSTSKVCTWDPEDRLIDVQWIGGSGDVRMSPDGLLALRGHEVWQVDDAMLLGMVEGASARWAAGNQIMAELGGGRYVFYGVDASGPVRTAEVVSEADYVAWSADAESMAVQSGSRLEIRWDGKIATKVFRKPDLVVVSIEWSPDGRLLAVVRDDGADHSSCTVFERSGRRLASWPIGAPMAIWSPDSQWLMAVDSVDRYRVTIYSGETGRRKVSIFGLREIRDLIWSADSESVVVNDRGWFRVWWLGRNKLTAIGDDGRLSSLDRDDDIYSVSWSPDRRSALVTHGGRNSAISTIEPPRPIIGRTGFAEWSPQGDLLAFNEGDDLQVADASSGRIIRTMKAPGQWHHMAWSPDGRLIACHVAERVKVFDVAPGAEIHAIVDLPTRSGPVWSPDSGLLAVAGHQGVEVHDVCDGTVRCRWRPPAGPPQIDGTAWSPSGDRIAILCGPVLYVWTLDGSSPDVKGASSSSDYPKLCWSPDGDLIASWRGGLTVWDAASGVAVTLPFDDFVADLSWTGQLTVVTVDGDIFRWEGPSALSPETWASAGRALTTQERNRFGLPPATGGAPASPAGPRPDRGP